MFRRKSSGRRAATRTSFSITEHGNKPGAAPRRREEPRTGSGAGSLRRNGPLALAVTATLAAVLVPQASADEGNVGSAATVASSVPASAEVDRVGLVERYMGSAGSADRSGKSGGGASDALNSLRAGSPAMDSRSGNEPESDGGPGKSDGGQDKQGHHDAGEGDDHQQQNQGKDSSSSEQSEGRDELADPLEKLERTSPFGPRINPLTGAPSQFHGGQDYAGACGTPVKSSADGKVTEAGWHPYGGGMRITVSHGDGLKTTYNHMSSMRVSVGDTVDEGDRIGRVGSTGASTGCHLHFEVVVDGEKVDPLKWL